MSAGEAEEAEQQRPQQRRTRPVPPPSRSLALARAAPFLTPPAPLAAVRPPPLSSRPQDKIMEIASFEKFLLDKIKVDGKTGGWGGWGVRGWAGGVCGWVGGWVRWNVGGYVGALL